MAGYWCIDTFTPLDANVWPAARGAVDCALTAAAAVLQGARSAYALVRPPGHHAERRVFGGFCYFNNAAIAANYLSRYGRVAVLDIDYHHGNGTQDIFYERSDVLTVSVHGHPSFAYPYFSGFSDETGRGAGAGFNWNLPLAETVTSDEHRAAVASALKRVAKHRPAYLVLALGLDTAAGDPTGTWPNRAEDFRRLGAMIGSEPYPIVVVQEGGYRVRTLGSNAKAFFAGLAEGREKPTVVAIGSVRSRRHEASTPSEETVWRESVTEADIARVRRLVASAGVFSTEEEALAAELVETRVAIGPASGYEFFLVEQADRLIGYTCYGPVPATDGRFELYWIAVAPEARGRGLARELLARTESAVRARGGLRLYAETSSTEPYEPAHRLYRRAGYRKAAEMPDFYRDGDSKLVLAKGLESATSPPPSRR
ncbi:MAG: acetoin utilization deacetylase AcuC-like enzyme/GNAT superfamily N-acetyltransferase [Hyphomicrobiaceae bacterium]